MSGGLPMWLRKRLSENGSQRAAKPGRCTKCRRNVLRGLNADRCAWLVEVDSQEIDLAGEVLASLRNVTTYDLVLSGGTWELCYRVAKHMKPARPYPVVPAHVCEYVYPLPAQPHALITRNEPLSVVDGPAPF